MSYSLFQILGNGYERDKFIFLRYEQEKNHILDMFNPSMFPNDKNSNTLKIYNNKNIP
jgi:hypothetical protein